MMMFVLFQSKARGDGKKRHLEEDDDSEDEKSSKLKLSSCKILDLEDMAFSQGSHFMSSKRCQLPDGSLRKTHKGYEEIQVPALKPRPFEEGEKLVPISTLPDWAQPAFDKFQSLNRFVSFMFVWVDDTFT